MDDTKIFRLLLYHTFKRTLVYIIFMVFSVFTLRHLLELDGRR